MAKSRVESIQENKVRPSYLIGIGSSAGGLEALTDLLSHLPRRLEEVALVVVQHLSPTYKSMLVQLLSRETELEVKEAVSGTLVKSNTVYITPPDNDIVVNKGKIMLKKPANQPGPKPSVDTFFETLAQDFGDKAIGIILSGTGTDGAAGIRAVKAAGGLTIVQEPSSAKYDGMPLAAIETGHVDLILTPSVIGEELHAILNNNLLLESEVADASPKSELSKIFNLLTKHYGTDFSNYKPTTIFRRLQKRMLTLKINNLTDYVKFIEKNPSELEELFNNILIGVTSFFRDKEAFQEISVHLKKIVSSKRPDQPIRIWVPGCATGEEAYSLAIVLAEALGENLPSYNIQIFATDIDEDALKTARKGQYPEAALAEVQDDVLKRYFLNKGTIFEVSKHIRGMVLFSRHDVTGNPPFLRLDLISCRNLLIYFGQELQKHIIPLFHYALNQDAYLMLGRSETVGHFTDLFSIVDGKNKIFQRKRGGNINAIKFSLFKSHNRISDNRSSVPSTRAVKHEYSLQDMIKETLFNTYEHPYVIVNDSMDIIEVSGDVRPFLGLSSGQMNANLIKLAQADLQIELRSLASKAIRERIPLKGKVRRISFFNLPIFVQITVKPLLFADPNDELFLVIFEKVEVDGIVSHQVDTQDQSESLKILELEQELGATREHLQTFIEELETSNEELQSLNEELQAANEELQSSNEELETTNEELQSSNEEIQVAYTELKNAHEILAKKEKELQLSQSNVKALLNNTLQSFVLIDKEYRIVDYNNTAWQAALETYKREMKAGLSIIDFVRPADLGDFYKDFNTALRGEILYSERCIPDADNRNRWYLYNYTPVYNMQQKVDVVSFSVLDITALRQTQAELANTEKLVSLVFDLNLDGVCITDENGCFVRVNKRYAEIYGFENAESVIGKPFVIVLPEEHREYAQHLHDEFIKTGYEIPQEWTVKRLDGELIRIFVTADLLTRDDHKRFKVTTIRYIGPVTDGHTGGPLES